MRNFQNTLIKTHLTQPIQLQPNLSFNSNSILQNIPINFFFFFNWSTVWISLLNTASINTQCEREREREREKLRNNTPSEEFYIFKLKQNKTNECFVCRQQQTFTQNKGINKNFICGIYPNLSQTKILLHLKFLQPKITLKHQNPIQLFLKYSEKETKKKKTNSVDVHRDGDCGSVRRIP